MKNLIKKVTSVALILVLMIFCITNVFAEEINDTCFDCTVDGSITIDYRYNDTPLDDVEFKVYQITNLDESGKNIILDEFENFDTEFDSLIEDDSWIDFRENLENYINYNKITPDKIFITDEYGEYKLEDLNLGIYLIQAETIEEDGIEYFSDSLLILVGSYDDIEEKWIYNYDVQPKISAVSYEMFNLTITKVWENTNSDLLIPEEITVELHRNGELYDTITISEKNMWMYTLYDVDPDDNWTVNELTELEDFEVDYEKEFMSLTITNTYIGSPDEELPQTGSYAYVISLIAGIGLIFILIGVLLKYKLRYK